MAPLTKGELSREGDDVHKSLEKEPFQRHGEAKPRRLKTCRERERTGIPIKRKPSEKRRYPPRERESPERERERERGDIISIEAYRRNPQKWKSYPH